MIPVFPYHIRRSAEGNGGELLLSLSARNSAFIIHLSLEQARSIAVEMRGLATDYCKQHHLVQAVAQRLGATISSVILRQIGGGWVTGTIRLETAKGVTDVDADVAAALGLAIHLGLPLFMEGGQASALEEATAREATGTSPTPPIPDAFLRTIETLDIPFPPDS